MRKGEIGGFRGGNLPYNPPTSITNYYIIDKNVRKVSGDYVGR
jgi:hypothetical protein